MFIVKYRLVGLCFYFDKTWGIMSMPVMISLWSTKEGELKRFLESFYIKKKIQCEEYTKRWMINFPIPLESIDIISALMDNCHIYDIKMYIHMENGYLYNITKENYNDVIRGLISIYYIPVKI